MDMHLHYREPTKLTKDGKTVGYAEPDFQASLTEEAWKRYNEFEKILTETAMSTGIRFLMPVYDRLAKSTLKSACLIAASRQRGSSVKVELTDLLHAIYYARQWRIHISEIVNGIGRSNDERLINTIYDFAHDCTEGTTRAELMRKFLLDMRRADLILGTMFQRKLLYMVGEGGQKRYKATDVV